MIRRQKIKDWTGHTERRCQDITHSTCVCVQTTLHFKNIVVAWFFPPSTVHQQYSTYIYSFHARRQSSVTAHRINRVLACQRKLLLAFCTQFLTSVTRAEPSKISVDREKKRYDDNCKRKEDDESPRETVYTSTIANCLFLQLQSTK
jgi:hypothetical protein